VNAAQIVEVMHRYFKGREALPEATAFAAESPGKYLTESLDVVDFLVYLEEEIGQEISINEVGESMMNLSFGELANDLAVKLAPA
jgi:hypothetical protein